jgi:hypothetical protein
MTEVRKSKGGNDESQGVREVLGKIPAAAFSDHGDLVAT